MTTNQSQTELLIKTFTSEYMEKLFYFFIKKTGNTEEAEDLTSETTLCIISELRKGIIPIYFSAWVWKIARNRYCKWADKKHHNIESVSGADFNEIDVADNISIEDVYTHSEDLNLLRRELAFIASDYRNIVVAYYIDDRKLHDIALSLNLPEGTVKTKLFKARKILKEGMKMAREFGIKSYKPEDIRLCMSGKDSKYGEPWSRIEKKIAKNIILEAYNNPSTVQQLSLELGVAIPYMEEEINILTKATLLHKNEDKYETDFCIISRQAQADIYGKIKSVIPSLTNKIIRFIEFKTDAFNKNGIKWHEGYQPYEDIKWALLMLNIDEINLAALKNNNMNRKNGHSKRLNGGRWDLLGYEEYDGWTPNFVGLHGCADSTLVNFGQFKFKYKNIESKTPQHLNEEQGKALLNVANNKQELCRTEVLEELEKFGYL